MKSEKEELELAVAKVEKMKLELTTVGDELNNCLEIKLKRLNGEMEALRRAVLKLIAERDELERSSDKSNPTIRYQTLQFHIQVLIRPLIF